MTEEKYTAEQLEQMADQLLQEAAPAQDKPAKGGLDEKTIASLPAAALLNGNEKLRDLFLTMKGRVPQVIDVEAGADFLHSDRSFDVCLYVTLESPEALEAYQQDPYHCEVVKTYVASVREKAVAVDYIV